MAIGRARSLDGFQDPALARRVERVLEQGERLHWVGRPDPGKGTAMDALQGLGLAVLFAGAGAFIQFDPAGLAGGFDEGERFVASLPLMVAALVALLIPIWRYLAVGATIYAVTDKRAVILYRFPLPWTKSFQSYDMNCLETTSHGGGAGSVVFRWDRRDGRGWTSWWRERNRVNLGGGWSIGGNSDDTWARHDDPDDELGARDRGEIARQGFFDIEDVAGAEQHLRRIVGDVR